MVMARRGMVCTSNPLASMAGIDVLKDGGNAVDAAICANAMLSVVEPLFCGPGGDLFSLVWVEKERKLFALNASGRSPYDWDLGLAQTMGLTRIPSYHPLSWNVPGCVSGWGALSERFGTYQWNRLFQHAVAYAKEGFPLYPVALRYWNIEHNGYPDLEKAFFPDGKAPKVGDIFTNRNLGDFFKTLSAGGPDVFYHGEIAERIVKYSMKVGGKLALKDFQDHSPDWVDPVCTTYKGYSVWEVPPSTQGIAALQILNMLEHLEINSHPGNSTEYLHLLIEAKKVAYEDRATYYADPQVADVPIERLISKEYARTRSRLIRTDKASDSVPAGILDQPSDTTYLTTADEEGNMVSLIQSNMGNFGSKYVPDNLGFVMQNRGSFFSLDPGHRNKLEPHKRPFHTIIPAFVTNRDEPVFSFGVLGAGFQPQGHVQILLNILEHGMSVQQAGEFPRVAHWGSSAPEGGKMTDGGTVVLEPGIPEEVGRALAERGHNVSDKRSVNGGYQGIWREEEPLRYFGGSDPRFDGCALGY